MKFARSQLVRATLVCAAALALFPPLDHARAEPARTVEERADLGRFFKEAGTDGTIAVLDTRTNRAIVSDRARAETGFLPHSTFKVPNSLIALETGIVQDADHPVFKWDGTERAIAAWNRDHTLRTAIAASVVPVYQEIARRIGPERMKRYVEALDYGNRDIGGAIDAFWLTGALRITAFEEIRFLARLYRDELPVSHRSQAIVKDIMPVEKAGEATIRAKTGLGLEGGQRIGWWVGWVERGNDPVFFAMNLDVREPRHVADRLVVTKAVLRELGAL